MADGVDALIDRLLKREGGFVDHPADRGGPTKYGITQKTLSAYLGRHATIDTVRRMTKGLAKEIYLRLYYVEPRVDSLTDSVREHIFDMAVNHGPRRAVRMLQGVLTASGFPCACDGFVGPQTRRLAEQAAKEMGPLLSNALVEAREEFYRSIVDRDPSQRVFLNGWLARADEFRVEKESA